MGRQVMFVIAVDIDTKEVFIDDDSLVARFASNEQIWNTETSEWESDDENSTAYSQALELLNTQKLASD
jgi:hypothetical protein